MQKVYNKHGEEKLLDPVDAREHIETGRWSYEAPEFPEASEVTFLDEHNEDINPAAIDQVDGAGDFEADQIEDHETNGGSEELDPASQEAYDQRQAAFEAAKNDVAEQVAEVEKEIKKSRSKK